MASNDAGSKLSSSKKARHDYVVFRLLKFLMYLVSKYVPVQLLVPLSLSDISTFCMDLFVLYPIITYLCFSFDYFFYYTRKLGIYSHDVRVDLITSPNIMFPPFYFFL